jgi:hypothetical protein
MTVVTKEDGTLVMFATRAPGQVAAQPDPSGAVVQRGAASGNPKFDPVTGRFAGGKSKGQPGDSSGNTPGPGRDPSKGNVDPTSVQRRRDLIRRAASQLDEMNMTEASTWLEGFGVDAASADLGTFLNDVHQQRIDYLVDAMVPSLRATVDAHHEGQIVQLKAPKSWSSSMLRSLTDGEILQLHQRLVGQGFDSEDVADTLVKGINNKKRKEQLQQVFGEPAIK